MFWRKERNMRPIKFRGKDSQSGEWFYGNLFVKDDRGRTHISTQERGCFRINPDTIGQFTGLIDKNGMEIYEGDIIHLNDEEFELEHGNGIVVFLEKDLSGRPCGGLWYVEDADEDSRTDTGLYDLWQCGELEIIGNIHDNPQLLKGGEM